MVSRREYEMLFQLNAQIGSNYNAAFTKAQAQVSAMQQQIVELGKTQVDISAYEKQQSSIEATRRKLETLQQQYDNIQREISETEGYSSSLENQLLSKKQAIEKTAAALDQQTQKAQQMGAALEQAGIDVNDLAKETDRLTGEIQALRDEQQGVVNGAKEMGTSGTEAIQAYHEALIASGILDALKGIYEGLMDCAEASVGFESSITGVYKTVDGTEEELLAISDEIKQLATEIPATTDEIAGVAEAAGQLGIATENVMEFTGVMINLGEATNLTADEAATSLAKFANITGTAASNYSRLGSVIVDLGNNFATTEADIVAMSTRLASGGRLAGLTEAEIMALAAAMSSVGIEAEAGGTAMTQTLNKIEMAVAENGKSLDEYARIAGMSADEFATAWEERPIEAIQAFIAGLGKLDQNGESAVIVLEELGLTGIRQSNMLKSLGLAADTLASAVGTANKAWDENIALTVEAEKRYATTESQQAMLQNAFNNLKIAIGDNYTPALREMYGVGTDVMIGLTNFVNENPKVVKAVTAAVAVIGLATAGVVAYSVAAKAAAAASAMLTAAIPGLNIIAGATLIVAGLTAALVALSPEIDEEAKAVREMTEASREQYYQLQDLKTEYEEACEVYGETSDEAMYLAWQVDELTTSFEHNKQSLSDYITENQEANENMATLLDTNRDTYQELIHNEGITLALVHRLQDLAAQTNKTVSTQEEMKAIIDELNETVPDLALNYEDVASGATDFGAAVEAAVKAEAATQKYEAAQQNMIDALNTQYDAKKRLLDLDDMRADAEERYEKASIAWQEAQNKKASSASLTNGAFSGSDWAEYQAAAAAVRAYEEEIETTTAVYEKATTDYRTYRDALVEYAQTIAKTVDESGNLNERITETRVTMEALAEVYDLVYQSAYDSVLGQYEIWDKAAKVVKTSADTINDAIDSQITYWHNYNSKLQSLTERSKEIEGLGDMIASFADGSSESVNAIAGMASASDEDLAAMVEDWKTLQTEQENVAVSIAELSTNFSSEMDALQQSLEADIKAMDLSEDAARSGRNTIEGFIDGAQDMLPEVKTAYENIAKAAMRAIDEQLDINSPSREMEWRAEMTWAGYINQTKAMEHDVEKAMAEAAAAGTAAVSTQVIAFSPELLSALQMPSPTEAGAPDEAGRSSSLPPIQVVVNIEGNATPDTVDNLKDTAGELIEAVLAAIDDREYDRIRRSY